VKKRNPEGRTILGKRMEKSALRAAGQPICPICQGRCEDHLGSHIRRTHGEEALRKTVLKAKEQGMPDAEIGAIFGVSFNALQKIITEAYGTNISVIKRPKRIKRWEPRDFSEERTTVWSFKARGDWATHDGRYRGNWSPYIPRNVILKYSKPGDVVLDYFVGGGTTAVEAKLLGRRCIARDINPGAVGITRENLEFSPPRLLFEAKGLRLYDPDVSVGDARDLSDIPDSSIDLICAHPPYAGIIKYSAKIPGDLSALSVQEFLREMTKVAGESIRVLKPGGKCAILIGDSRKSKHVVPIGFKAIRVFLEAGFTLKELVIKRQHNCKSTGFWYSRSIKQNFLLLAHEYLPIFEKPIASGLNSLPKAERPLSFDVELQTVENFKENDLETTTVWIFPEEKLRSAIRRNLSQRFAKPGGRFLEITVGVGNGPKKFPPIGEFAFVHVKLAPSLRGLGGIPEYRGTLKKIAEKVAGFLSEGSVLVVETQDIRIGDFLEPMGFGAYESLSANHDFTIKECVVVVRANHTNTQLTLGPDRDMAPVLNIEHRYLLIYRRKGGTQNEKARN